ETLKRELAEKSLLEDLLTLESRIDKLALLSFDLYMQCRTQLFEIRLHEIRHSTARTWERICRKYGITDEPSESHDDDSTLR
ncbi:MAG: hypothetical protein HY914_19660, partial [Desulfomonile tiedjei]|nr:hypothetical protein [Desulfomonile tiedjei]